jgi:glycosyltransferase involved in cell wall biosynthesis
VLIVSQYFPPEIGATQSRMESFAEHLANAGHDVTVVCEFPNHPHGVIPEEYRGRLVEDDRSKPYRILRVWVKANPEKTQRTRLSFYVSYMAMASVVAPLLTRPDVVLATTPPLFGGLAGAFIARLRGVPFVLDVRDLWPAAAVSLGQISGGRPLRLAEAIERYLYRRADAVVAVTRPFCEHIDTWREGKPRTALIPNGTLERFFDDVEPVDRVTLGTDESRFLVTFAGTLGIAQALPSVLEAAAQSNGRLHYALVGEGPLKQRLMEDAASARLDNVSFVDALPPDRIAPVLRGSDALLVSLSAHPLFRDFIPSKLLDYMASGRPIILAAAGESAQLLERADAGIVVEPEKPAELAAAARWLADHPEDAAAMGRRGREFARRRLRTREAERLEAVLLDVTRRSSRPASASAAADR